MREGTFWNVASAMLVIVSLLLAVGIVSYLNMSWEEVRYVSTCAPADDIFFDNTTRLYDGRAYIDHGYFCVWAAEREWKDVLDTCRHEYAHVIDYTVHPSDLEGLE